MSYNSCYILSESNGDYHQTIKIGYPEGNHLEIRRDSEIIYDGIANHIIDSGNTITWKTPEGEQKEIRKYVTYTYA
jgi:hypothetical protein